MPTPLMSTTKLKTLNPDSSDTNQLGNQITDTPITSVHPIDTLSKKLRQQALELTHVYEELEKQNLQIDSYKKQVQDLKRQLEMMREQQRKYIDNSLKTPSGSRTIALDQQKRATQLMISNDASIGQKREELDRKVKEAESEKMKYQVAAKRIEKALAELKVFQNTQINNLLPLNDTSDQEKDEAIDIKGIVNEQRAYIRVLEEAVHLKATDFDVTGHEELLVVLAELRHTIYEQEKNVVEKSDQLESIQGQLDQEQQRQRATFNDLEAARKQLEEMDVLFRKNYEDVQCQLLKKVQEMNELQTVVSDAQRLHEALQDRLQAAITAKTAMQATINDMTRIIKSLNEQFENSILKCEETQKEAERLQNECTAKQTHLDDMNVLQEELLDSVDNYVCKLKKSRDKVKRLQAELKVWQEKEMLSQNQLKEVARVSDERINVLYAEVEATTLGKRELVAQNVILMHDNSSLKRTLADVKKQLDKLIQARDTQEEMIDTKTQRFCQMEQDIAELEAALSAALYTISDTCRRRAKTDDNTDDTEADRSAFLQNDFVLCDLKTCCQALTTFITRKMPIRIFLLGRALNDLCICVATIGERVVTEVNRALASWARERDDLVAACATLVATASLCKHEMENRHDEIRDCREELVTREAEIERYVVQQDTLHEKLRSATVDCEEFYALKELAKYQGEILKAKKSAIRDLSAKNDRLALMGKALESDVAALSQQIQDQKSKIHDQKRYADEKKQVLEKAAAFAEEQNEYNCQLQSQLAEMRMSQQEQNDLVKTLKEQIAALFSQILRFIKYLLQSVTATDYNLQDDLKLVEAEFQKGDVTRLLQLFPDLLNKFIDNEACHLDRSVFNDSDENQWKFKALDANIHSKHINASKPALIVKPPARSISSSFDAQNDKSSQCFLEMEEEGLAEQWKFIQDAFRSYKIT
ncbi:uncharacterized protein PHALS_04769 [Plasmopara halstedii]|uniref:Uncharacterized protein n=1 Tax=Plasmopara halstedii TaxID=4781 RepID=A0A0N7L7P1_PLAHL|nr:uncharacterized protein PHALS_04769 [Plasmopara halstedii]CEG47619.1 hypothetical protein PHALS_04769 [Plasmopara halstedii]|eukprot:XP_024583988.1 hypothetical protein PHALS_04769 [Plasmopara halstedii]